MANKNLNLVEILKDCPKGTKLYSTIHGEVEFEKIITDSIYPIVFTHRDIVGERYIDYVTEDGKHRIRYCGECTLFPSKNQRDWSKFKVEPEIIDGEFYYCSLFNKHKDIYIHRKTTECKTEYYAKLDLCDLGLLENGIITTNEENIKELRKATDEEKEMFFNILQKNGYKWDEEKKELVRIEKKFDISTLQPFDKVLVRDSDESMWRCNFYDSHVNELDFPFKTIYGWYKQCIPYNEETRHLVGKTMMPPKKYITWEE